MKRFIRKAIYLTLAATLCTPTSAKTFALTMTNDSVTTTPNAPSDIKVSVKTRIQPAYYFADTPIVSERDTHDMRIRRARLAVKAEMDQRFTTYLQTAYSESPNSASSDARIIDAYITTRINKNYLFYAGQFLAPSLRQNITSAGAILAFDRPGITYKSLSWGTRALTKFSTLTMDDTDAGLRGNVDVRDMGAMVLGTHSYESNIHYKYYAGIFEGARSAQSDRFVFRGQLNIGAPENKHINQATYFGSKETVAFGVSYDTQKNVAINSANLKQVNYSLYSADIFIERGIGAHSFNLESAWIKLDLDSADQLLDPLTNTPLSPSNAKQSEGHGAYLQMALTINKWQPWFGVEAWSSKDEHNRGSYQLSRMGITYIIDKKKANIKFGIENTESEYPIHTAHGQSNHLTTVVAGIFYTF